MSGTSGGTQTTTSTALGGAPPPGAEGGGQGAGGGAQNVVDPKNGAQTTQTTTQQTTTQTGGTQQGGEQGKGTGEGKGDAAPVEYKFQFPEGFTPDEKALGAFTEIAKANGLKPEAAQKFVELFANTQLAAVKQANDAAEATRKEWGEKLTADQEFGGEKWKESLTVARKAIHRFATPELRSFLESTGLGDHPELFRTFYRVGLALKEDSVGGTTQQTGGGEPTEADFHRQLYPSMFPQQG